VVKGELHVAEGVQRALAAGVVPDPHVPQDHLVPPGDEDGLGGGNPLARAQVLRIAESVAAGIAGLVQRNAHRLPADRPVFSGFRVPQVRVVAGAVHRHAVGAEAGDAVVFRRIQPRVAARRVVEHAAHPLGADVVGPGDRHVHPVDHVLPGLVVKMTVTHQNASRAHFQLSS